MDMYWIGTPVGDYLSAIGCFVQVPNWRWPQLYTEARSYIKMNFRRGCEDHGLNKFVTMCMEQAEIQVSAAFPSKEEEIIYKDELPINKATFTYRSSEENEQMIRDDIRAREEEHRSMNESNRRRKTTAHIAAEQSPGKPQSR